MSVLSDQTITELCTGEFRSSYGFSSVLDVTITSNEHIENNDQPMIFPFVDHLVRENEDGYKVISYGLSSYGYDVRLRSDNIKLFTNVNSAIVDPMSPDERCYIDAEILHTDKGHRYVILPPNSYALGATQEYFRIPKNVTAVCWGKSTLARSALAVNVTPIESGFEGEVVIEVANHSNLPVKMYLDMGIAQFQFFVGDRPCTTSYADRAGKYQGQTGITLSRT